MKILLADDSPSDRLIIRRYLQSAGHEVILAEDGEQAIKTLQREDPDLVLLDVRMPGMDGYETVARMRGQDIEWRPILFLSGDNEQEDFVKGIEAGGDDYLYKPVNKEVLAAKMMAMERIVAMRKELITVTAELAWETEKAKHLANLDGLTGLANRRYLNEILDVELKRAAREKESIALIMVDIDFFKQYNDFFGHLSGDDALKDVARILKGVVNRPGDVVARYGGEEFCVVLPNTSKKGAHLIAEMLRKAVLDAQITQTDKLNSPWLTISLGVSARVPVQDVTAEEMLQLADKALYAAKEGGRNRVCMLDDKNPQQKLWQIKS